MLDPKLLRTDLDKVAANLARDEARTEIRRRRHLTLDLIPVAVS
mgnify:CR=1 FL=1